MGPLTIVPHSHTLRPTRDLRMGPDLRRGDTEFVVVAVPSTHTEGVRNITPTHCGFGITPTLYDFGF